MFDILSCKITVPECGVIISQSELSSRNGTITSPNYPNNYTNNLNCTWTLRPNWGLYKNMLHCVYHQWTLKCQIAHNLKINIMNDAKTFIDVYKCFTDNINKYDSGNFHENFSAQFREYLQERIFCVVIGYSIIVNDTSSQMECSGPKRIFP